MHTVALEFTKNELRKMLLDRDLVFYYQKDNYGDMRGKIAPKNKPPKWVGNRLLGNKFKRLATK